MIPTIPNEDDKFPSPVGVWVVSWQSNPASEEQRVSVPLRGVGCFSGNEKLQRNQSVSVPLRGVGCFLARKHGTIASTVSVPLRGVGCFLRVS